MTVHNDATMHINLTHPFGHEGYTLADLKADNKQVQKLLADLHQDLQHLNASYSEDDVKTIEKALAKLGIECDHDEEGQPRGGRSGKSWIQALAAVLGKVADQKAQALQQAADGIGSGGDDPSKMIDFQVISQEFTLMMNTFTGAVKSITEGVAAPAQASAR